MAAIRIAKPEDVPGIVDVHVAAFDGFLLTKLGRRFLQILYVAFATHQDAVLLVSYEPEMANALARTELVSGFAAGAVNPEGFFRQLRRKRGLSLAFASWPGLLRHPKAVLGRLIAAAKYRGDSVPATEGFALLSSLAIDPEFVGRGVGTQLVNRFVTAVRERGAKGIYLLTDATENAAARAFYEANGFKVHARLRRSSGRVLLVYVRECTA